MIAIFDRRRVLQVLALGVSLLWFDEGGAQAPPRPPCGTRPYPAYGAVDAAPNVSVWSADELRGWTPPSCTGWASGSTVVVGLAGTFSHPDGADGLLARFGAVYRHAWQYLRRAERALGSPLVVPRPGRGRPQGGRS